MKRVTRLEVLLVLDNHKKVPLRTIEIQPNMMYVVNVPRDDLSLYNQITINIVTNAEETEP